MEVLDNEMPLVPENENEIEDLKESIREEIKTILKGRAILAVIALFQLVFIVFFKWLSTANASAVFFEVAIFGIFTWAFWYSQKQAKLSFIIALAVYWFQALISLWEGLMVWFLGRVTVRIIFSIIILKALVACGKFETVRRKLSRYGVQIEIPLVFDY